MQQILVCAFGLSGFIAASGAAAQPTWPYPVDLHSNNRAIAFGSALMVTENHSDPMTWKKVEADPACSADSGGSTPVPSDPTPPSSDPASGHEVPPSPGSNCYQSVYYVTHYSFVECSDGRAYILRSGEGVSVVSPKEGYFFGWAEGAPCNASAEKPIPGEPAPPPVESPAKQWNMDKDRHLDFSRISVYSLTR